MSGWDLLSLGLSTQSTIYSHVVMPKWGFSTNFGGDSQ